MYRANFIIIIICVVTAEACFKDRGSPVTIQNYEGPIYVSPCNQIPDNHCSQLYHISGNPTCDCDCSCVSKHMPPVVYPPQVPCGQPCTSTQVPCVQPCGQVPCNSCSGGIQGCVSYLQTWQGSGTQGYYQSCPDCNGWHYKGNDWGSLPVAKCANQLCQCGVKRSGYY